MDILEWLVPWEPSVTVVVCVLLAAILYVRGARGFRALAWPRQLAFWVGLAVIYIGLHTHLDYYAQHEFFMHRLQHLGLHHMGPFLIMLALPGMVFRRALPLKFRCRVLKPLFAFPPVRLAREFLFHPLVAAILFVGLIFLWLVPSIHFIAMLDVHLYKVMNWSMTIDGLLFWWLILDRRSKPPAHLSPGMRVLVAGLVIPPQILVGAYITFTGHDLYAIYDVCGRVFLDISAATDQYLGGLILWIPSGMMGVLGGLVAFGHWMRLDSAGRLPRHRRREPRPQPSAVSR